MKDILFKDEDFVFSYRISGILVHNNKILLQKPKNDDYALIGGHVSCMETSRETLMREYKEEIHADIEVDNLIGVGEIFFRWGKKPCHQIGLYYKVRLKDETQIPTEGVFSGYDELGGKRIDLDFCWVDMAELENIKVYPEEMIPHIISGSDEIIHFISKQI